MRRPGLEIEPGCPDTGQLRASGLCYGHPHMRSSPIMRTWVPFVPQQTPTVGESQRRAGVGRRQHTQPEGDYPRDWELGTSYCPHWASILKKEILECHLDIHSFTWGPQLTAMSGH